MRHLLTRYLRGRFSGRLALHIPTEVCENIIDMLYSDYFLDPLKNFTTLRSCALVCRAWRVRSQRVLFYRIQLSHSASFHRLSAILEGSAGQHLRGYVQEVELTGYHLHNTTSIFALFPSAFARKLPNLKRVDVIHLLKATRTSFPRIPPPKSKPLPYIPLHPRFPAFLPSFSAVSFLSLEYTTFHSFTDFVRMLRGLQNLEELGCQSVRWLPTPSGAHDPGPGATSSSMKPPDWAAGRRALPPFAPKLRTLSLRDLPTGGAEWLIASRGPYLTRLELAVPLSSDTEQPVHGRPIDLSPCTGLKTLIVFVTPQFSTETHVTLVKALLTSWKPQQLESLLTLRACTEWDFTRRGFAGVLRSLGTVAETWLQAVNELPAADGSEEADNVQYLLRVVIHDWEDMRQWWFNRLTGCFPTWTRLARLRIDFRTPTLEILEWARVGERSKSSPVQGDNNLKILAPARQAALTRWVRPHASAKRP